MNKVRWIEGDCILNEKEYSIKLTSDRSVWIKHKSQNQYSQAGKCPKNLSREMKEIYLKEVLLSMRASLSKDKGDKDKGGDET